MAELAKTETDRMKYLDLAQAWLSLGEAIACNDKGLAVFEMIRRHRHASAILCASGRVEPAASGPTGARAAAGMFDVGYFAPNTPPE